MDIFAPLTKLLWVSLARFCWDKDVTTNVRCVSKMVVTILFVNGVHIVTSQFLSHSCTYIQVKED